jgi:AraC family transcriptional regulator
MRTWYADANLRIGEWWCPGAVEAVGAEEVLPMHELVLMRVGGHVRRSEQARAVLDAAHVVRTSAGVPFRPVHAIGLPQRATYAHLSDALVNAMPPLRDRMRIDPAVARAHMRLLQVAASSDAGDRLAIHETAMGLVAAVTGASAKGRQTSRDVSGRARAAVERTAQRLAFHYADDLTLEALAADVGLSPWYLSRVFRRIMGRSIWEQVTALRLHAALDRIAQGEVNLSALAIALGFSSHSHFSQSFRRAFGVAPSLIRFDGAGAVARVS